MPSELVNSVISRPQPPRPRMTRRKSVSVTPAKGARTAAGRMVRSRIWKDAGIMELRRLLCRRVLGLQEFIEAEEFAAEGAAVGGPLGFAAIDGEGRADGGELGIQIVHVVEGHGFADHGELWRAEFVLAVMADEKMLDDGLQVRRKTFDGIHGLGDGFEFHHDVAEELAFDGVADGALVAQFFELA